MMGRGEDRPLKTVGKTGLETPWRKEIKGDRVAGQIKQRPNHRQRSEKPGHIEKKTIPSDLSSHLSAKQKKQGRSGGRDGSLRRLKIVIARRQ